MKPQCVYLDVPVETEEQNEETEAKNSVEDDQSENFGLSVVRGSDDGGALQGPSSGRLSADHLRGEKEKKGLIYCHRPVYLSTGASFFARHLPAGRRSTTRPSSPPTRRGDSGFPPPRTNFP